MRLAKRLFASIRKNPKRGKCFFGYERLVWGKISVQTKRKSSITLRKGLGIEATPKLLEGFFGIKDQTTSPEQAAMALVANALLNLDEFLNQALI